MKEKYISREKMIGWGFLLCVFTFTAVHFLDEAPLVLDNGDGWVYAAFTRSALPVWKGWNPGKVLPEVLYPLCAQFGVTFIKPLCGDYIWSISVAAGLFMSLLITLYTGMFAKLLQRMMKLNVASAALISGAFFLFHFKSWMSPWIPGRHLFYSFDLNNTFNYVVPALLNCILMFYLMMRQQKSLKMDHQHMLAEGTLFLVVYLAVFSNVFLNCILAVYAGVCLLEGLYIMLRKKQKLADTLRENLLHVYILVLWGICAFFELSGGRAGSLSNGSQIDRLKAVIWEMLDAVELMDDVVFFGCIALMAAGLIVLAYSRMRREQDVVYGKLMLRHAVNVALITTYLLLLGSVVGRGYLCRTDVLVAIMVHVLMMTFFSVAYMLEKMPKLALVLPTAVFILSIEVFMGMSRLELTNIGNTTQHVLDVNRNLVQQIVDADQKGLKEVTLLVPYTPTSDNFPYPDYMGSNILRTLQQHRMVENIQRVHIQPDENYHEIFGIAPGSNSYYNYADEQE